MYWTKKHDEFCLLHKITASSAVLLFKYIIRRTKTVTTEELEIDLKNFNCWIKQKRGKGYDPKTLKEAIAMICDRSDGMVVEFKHYSWYCRKLIVKPVTFFAKKKSPKIGEDTKTESPNPSWRRSSNDEKLQQQQQDISNIDKLTKKIGLKYDPDALNNIWRLSGKSINRVIKAIELMVYRNHSNKPIANLLYQFKYFR